MTRSIGTNATPKVLVVHITTVRCAEGAYPWEVDLPRGSGRLKVSSVAKCGEIYTLRKAHLTGISGTLRSEHMERVDRVPALALGLSASAL